MKKLIGKIIIIMMLIIMITPLKSYAGFQANKGGTSYTITTGINANNLFEGIRKMETEGETLGLSANLAETSYLDTTNNNLDCHMVLNTEWGTAAMLATSIYGMAPSGYSTASTTGNDSGICQMSNGNGQLGNASKGHELVAGIYTSPSVNTSKYINTIKNADPRYYNLYGTNKIGDGLSETPRWKGATNTNPVGAEGPIYQRDYGTMFGFYLHQGIGVGSSSTNYNYGTMTYASTRAVVVCGEGL